MPEASPRVLIFGEDSGHEKVVDAIVRRVAHDVGVDLRVDTRSARGGFGRAMASYCEFIANLRAYVEPLPTLIVAALDANRIGLQARREEILAAAGEYADLVVPAVPEPYVERWLLLDSAAFKHVLGRGCSIPDKASSREDYKRALLQACRDAGVSRPSMGGIEFGADIVKHMALNKVTDASLGSFVRDLRAGLRRHAGA